MVLKIWYSISFFKYESKFVERFTFTKLTYNIYNHNYVSYNLFVFFFSAFKVTDPQQRVTRHQNHNAQNPRDRSYADGKQQVQ